VQVVLGSGREQEREWAAVSRFAVQLQEALGTAGAIIHRLSSDPVRRANQPTRSFSARALRRGAEAEAGPPGAAAGPR